MWIIGGLLLVGMLLVLYMSMDIKRIAEESDAPYKLEPAEQLAVSKPRKKTGRPLGSKGGYTKRSSYWDEQRKRSAAKKARQEKMRSARAKVRESIGR